MMDGFSKKLRVLIADDAQETRRSTRLMLSTLDNVEVVAIASNGLQAIEMTKEQRPDILVMDINMPQMDGLTAYKHISRLYPGTACIIISAETDPRAQEIAEVLGVQAYLTKPFILEELESAIKYAGARVSEFRAKHPAPDKYHLEQLAAEYAKARRADDQAVQVFEFLARDPHCNVRWLKTLVMLYAIRQEWGKLKALAERLDNERA